MVLRMSHALGIRVNAEGVEHECQAALLHEEGCEEVPGFLFSRAVDGAAFSELLARNARETSAREFASVGRRGRQNSGPKSGLHPKVRSTKSPVYQKSGLPKIPSSPRKGM